MSHCECQQNIYTNLDGRGLSFNVAAFRREVGLEMEPETLPYTCKATALPLNHIPDRLWPPNTPNVEC